MKKPAKPLPRIIQVNGYYPPHLGGSEIVTENLARGLAEIGYPVTVLTSNVDQGRRPKVEKLGRLSIFRLKAREFAHTPLALGFIWKLARAPKQSIIHLHLAQAYYPEIVLAASKIRRIPYVVHFHLDLQPSGKFGKFFLIYKKLVIPAVIRHAADVIVFSRCQKQFITDTYGVEPSRVHIIPNGVAKEYLSLYRPNKRLHKKLRLLFVGRLSAQKRVDRLIRALELLKYPYHLDIVGAGEEQADLRKLVKKLGLREVTFHGLKSNKQLSKFYQQADVFILPSDAEGMPLAMLEAMAAGLPVIGSDVPGIREHLNKVGVVVPDPSPQSFAAAINTFTKRYKRGSLSKPSRLSHQFAEQFSWEKVVAKVAGRYRQVQRQALKKTVRPAMPARPKYWLYALVVAWWLIFLGVHSAPQVPEFVSNSLGFSFLLLVPGLLSVWSMRRQNLSMWGQMCLGVGLSVLEIMAAGLIGNTVLKWFGVAQPLQPKYLIAEVSLLTLGLLIAGWKRINVNVRPPLGWIRLLPLSPLNIIFWLVPLIFVGLAAGGAVALNNGASDPWTVLMLGGIAVYSAGLLYFSKRLNSSTFPWAIFLIALSLLLMTSLRSWYISGHDVQGEMRVFELAKNHAVWQIQRFRDPYNACLSITILPTMFFNLLRSADATIFKVYFQIIFAFCPVVIYLIIRKWASRSHAYLSALYFMAFPTFFTDMPMLNRQEIAFLFFSLIIYILFSDSIHNRLRQKLFLVLATGLVLSHYSTTYSAIAIFGMALLLSPLVKYTALKLKKYNLFSESSFRMLSHNRPAETRRLTIKLVGTIVVISFLWTTVLTNTGGGVIQLIKTTAVAITKQFNITQARSTDTNYSLFSLQKTNSLQEIKDYNSKVAVLDRAKYPNLYYPASFAPTSNIKPVSQTRGLSYAGKRLESAGFNVPLFNEIFRQSTAKILQVFILIGLLYMLTRKISRELFDSEFVTLALSCIVFVALQVILPVVSVDYGILRAFQQSLMLLGILIVTGSLALPSLLTRGKRASNAFPAVVALVFFLSTTGFMTQILGGYPGQLQLNNSGVYYDIYYTHKSELAGYSWLKSHTPLNNPDRLQSDLQADGPNLDKFPDIVGYDTSNDIFPSLIRKNSYVFLGYTNVHLGVATLLYNSDTVPYKYPLGTLNSQKNLIYSNGDVNIYK